MLTLQSLHLQRHRKLKEDALAGVAAAAISDRKYIPDSDACGCSFAAAAVVDVPLHCANVPSVYRMSLKLPPPHIAIQAPCLSVI